MKKLTIFTPTFNRQPLLPRLYESLKSQTNKDFIWMVIDDGSTDETEEVVKKFRAENEIEILYFYKENEGMHSAHNVAYEKITTPWNTCIDSDDQMHVNAVEIINREIEKVTDERCYGLVGLDADLDGNILGQKIPAFLSEIKMMELASVHGITGDKKLVYKTLIMKSLPPYPIFKGEKLVPLSYKSLEAENRNFYLQPLNEILCLVEYQDDGSTKNMLQQYRRNPRGFAFVRRAKLNAEINLKEKVKSAIHLVSSTFFTGDFKNLFTTQNSALVIASIPAGILLHLYIRLKTKKNK